MTPLPERPERIHGLDVAGAAAVAVAVLLVRAIPVLSSSFPLNDGGLFFAMARDLQRAGLQWPATTSYNGGGIPFTYPPLGLYLAAVLSSVSPISLIDVVRWLPLVFSVLTVPAVYLLAREVLASRFHALVAAAAFAVVPEGFVWAIEGGGITRAPGMLFALLAVALAARTAGDGRRRTVVAAGVLGGLAVLTHPNAALFTVIAVLLLALRHPTRRSIARVGAIYALTLLVSSPWWIVALVRLGPRGLASTGVIGDPIDTLIRGSFGLVTFEFTREALLPVVAALGLVGLVLCLSRRMWLLPIWVSMEVLIDPRLGRMYAMVPLAMLAAVGFVDAVVAAVVRTSAPIPRGSPDRLVPAGIWTVRAGRWTLIFGLVFTTFAAMYAGLLAGSPDRAVPDAVRSAMAWPADNTLPGARFAVVTGDQSGILGDQEWFPVLSGRISQATVQGTEWLGPGAWTRANEVNGALQECASGTVACLEQWSARYDITLDHVFLPKGQLGAPGSPADCCGTLRESLAGSPHFRLVYDGEGATIYRREPDALLAGRRR